MPPPSAFLSCQPLARAAARSTAQLLRTSSALSRGKTTAAAKEYDVFIVGGGVTGSALLYELAAFTNLKKLGLAERRRDFAMVASGPNNNSQTIHCGDIETNYSFEKARVVKKHADMLRNFATKLPAGQREACVQRMQKMVIGVGEDEMEALETRFPVFKQLFPDMQLLEKRQIAAVEPNVVKGRPRNQRLNALYTPDEHSAVNYYEFTKALVQQAVTAAESSGKDLDVATRCEVKDVMAEEDDSYTVITNRGKIHTKFLVVAGCGYSLLFAHKLGYGLRYGCLPVAGSFYFAKHPVLTGKVYTVQDPKLPFAAVHGDPDVHAKGKTRFGPTALPLPLLERYNTASLRDWWQVSGLDLKYAQVVGKMMFDPTMISYTARNFLYETPGLGTRLFLKDAQKIVPAMQLGDLAYATGYGGVRPQLVDKKAMKLQMGEGKILGKNAIFNVTPSPGATTCLGNGEADMRTIVEALGAELDEQRLSETLHQGEYPIPE